MPSRSPRAAASPPEAEDGLDRYRAKRDFARTAEPRGQPTAGATGWRYVIHKHAARRLHYDLRLELDGALKSWAVPQGPSLDPRQRRLAVHVEDHPLDYGGFEGTIPKGQYGGGTVMLWDRGRWEPLGDPAAGYAAGKLRFRLVGEKLQGAWTLARMGGGRGKAEGKDLWLLIKSRDAAAREADEPLAGEDRSVLTGRTMAEIARGSRETTPVEQPLPRFVAPQLATLVETPPEGQEWLFELKHDGYRAQLRIEGGKAAVLTRGGHDWTERFPAIAEAAAALPVRSALIDGEIVALESSGASSFARLKATLAGGARHRLYGYLFDLLFRDGQDLRTLPLVERKRLLAELLEGRQNPRSVLRFSDHLTGDGELVWRQACRLGAEGIVAKRADAPYRSGRGETWLKVKCRARQELVVGGFTPVKGREGGLGALLTGVHDDGRLVYVGKVGTGWDEQAAAALLARLEPLRTEKPPFAGVPAPARRGARWVEPRLVAEVAFQGWTGDGQLRHATFQGLREDRDPAEVARERPAPAAENSPLELHGVRISHPDRRVLDEPPLTKGDLARYYADAAELILPHVAGRPLSVIRCPDRLGQGCFFQRHPMPGMPKSVRPVRADADSRRPPYLAIDDAAGLLALVQFGAIELHPGGARADRPNHPDRLIFDLDPGPEVAWAAVMVAAVELKERLAELRLEAFCKTTGGKGLHVVLPIERRHDWPTAKAFTRSLAEAMASDSPDRYTATLAKAARTGRIFIDYLRNDRDATAVAPYSLRGRPGAPVAMPVAWEEVTPSLQPGAFSIATALHRARGRVDPWAGIARCRQRLPRVTPAAGR